MQFILNRCSGLRTLPYNLPNIHILQLRNPICRTVRLKFSVHSRYNRYGNARNNVYFKNRDIMCHPIARIAVKRILPQIPEHNSRRKHRYFYSLFAILVIATCSTFIYFEGYPRFTEISHVIIESILNSHKIQMLASKFAGEVVTNVLNDQKLHDLATEKLKGVILESQTILEDIFFKVINSDETLDAVTKVSKEVTEQLCNDPYIQERVGHLLLMSIKTDAAVDGASKWVVELFEREEIKESIITLFAQHVFSDIRMQNEALQFCKNVSEELLHDKQTLDESVTFLKSILSSPSVHNHLSKTLWEVFKLTIYPRWLSRFSYYILLIG